MGEIADMMLDGTLCGGCGDALDGESPGYPRYCSKDCEPEGHRDAARHLLPRTMLTLQAALNTPMMTPRAKKAARHNRERKERAKAARKPCACDQCPKMCRTPEGLAQHKRDKHP